MKHIKLRQSVHSKVHTALRQFWLKQRDDKLGLSQRALAARLQVPRSLISKVETGR
ncbi:helix-turn-helix transcriptional regulator [Isorropodon fossajaponicum symbiont]|uniref:helix-turn-helix transcriptional regulator n=1 Tax=Isorropodon fossajaponicum symbiont TaxID=883811 RepID=UPI003159D0F0